MASTSPAAGLVYFTGGAMADDGEGDDAEGPGPGLDVQQDLLVLGLLNSGRIRMRLPAGHAVTGSSRSRRSSPLHPRRSDEVGEAKSRLQLVAGTAKTGR